MNGFRDSLAALLCVCLMASMGLAMATGRSGPSAPINVVTQNVYLGADLDIILDPDVPKPIPLLVADFLLAIESTNFPERAKAIADQIRATRAHLVGLQEVTLIRFQGTGDVATGNLLPNAEDTVIDFLEILLKELNSRRPHYEVASTVRNADVELPAAVDIDGNGMPDDIRLTDRDVILARTDVPVSNATAATYNALRVFDLDAGGTSVTIPVKRGFATVDATVGGITYLFATTHLENKSDAPEIQAAQAADLIGELNSRDLPIVLVGDFNSGPTDPMIPFPAPYWQLLAAGFGDAWEERANLSATFDHLGYTCCQDETLQNTVSELDKRIDLILFRGNVSGRGSDSWKARTQVLGDQPDDKTPSGLWPSDHAGVMSYLRMR